MLSARIPISYRLYDMVYISQDNAISCSHYGNLFPIRTNDENGKKSKKTMTGKFQSESFYFVLFPVKGVPLASKIASMK